MHRGMRSACSADERPQASGPTGPWHSILISARSPASSLAGVARNASRISTPTAGAISSRLSARTFASFQHRAPCDHRVTAQRGARRRTLFAAIETPVPVSSARCRHRHGPTRLLRRRRARFAPTRSGRRRARQPFDRCTPPFQLDDRPVEQRAIDRQRRLRSSRTNVLVRDGAGRLRRHATTRRPPHRPLPIR